MYSLLRRPRPQRIAAGSGLVETPNLGQVRFARQPKGGAPVPQKLASSFKKKGGDQGAVFIKKDKKLGAFKPLSVNQFEKIELLKDETRAELQLPLFKPEVLTKELSLGKVLEFPAPENDPMRKFGLPKNLLLEYRILSKPCAAVRDVTLNAVAKLDQASQSSSAQNRVVLTGATGSGKSVALLQAVEYCMSNDWIVLYIPRAATIVNSSTPHTYDARTRTYLQPKYSFQLLQRFLSVNESKLQNLKTSREHVLERSTLPAGSPIIDLLSVGLNDQASAPSVLSTLLSELASQESHPVLLAIDEIQALYCRTTMYRNPRFEAIKPYHLSLPRLLLEYTSGKRSFKRGAVFGALSGSTHVFRLTVELGNELAKVSEKTTDPYVRQVPELVEYAKGLQNLPVPQLSLNEAASIFEIWAKDRALYSSANDELFMAKYTEAQGNARDFVWKGLLSTLSI
ncbi:mitochondrial ribosomal death-associated protein 3-domain-containing protein [Abortiporus biennis]|nr:mitochondrial ribosomal death-associated protein 3-domain-containing protein [Abortiporus biennis]